MYRLAVPLAVLLAIGVLFPAGASAVFGSVTLNQSNTLTAAVLDAPGRPDSVHPSPTSGTVQLSWTPSSSSFVSSYGVERATNPVGPFTTVASISSTSHSDTTAAYNSQYYYRAVATYQNWTAAGGVNMALSLPPTSGTDTTGLLSYGLSGSDLSALAVADSSRYTTQGTWPRLGFDNSQYVEFRFSPTVVTDAPVTSVKVTLVYRASALDSGTAFRLLVSPDGGASWTPYSLPRPGSAGADMQATVDVTSLVDTPSRVQNMRLRFQSASNVGLLGPVYNTSHDLVHVDVN